MSAQPPLSASSNAPAASPAVRLRTASDVAFGVARLSFAASLAIGLARGADRLGLVTWSATAASLGAGIALRVAALVAPRDSA